MDRGELNIIMNIELINKNENILNTIFTACKTCYSELDIHDILKQEIAHDKKLGLVQKIMRSGHLSTVEHINLTFCIDGITRACAQQLTRHRIASFSMKSQRYVASNFDFEMPDSIKEDETKSEIFADTLEEVRACYDTLLALGCKKEDARAILPNCTTTSVMMTINLRSFINMCNERLCLRAQKEIRQLVNLMKFEILKNENNVFLREFLKPKCDICKEFNKCTSQGVENQNK